MAKIMINVGSLVAKQIDAVARKHNPTYEKDRLYKVIKHGNSHIGRLLHYFPFDIK